MIAHLASREEEYVKATTSGIQLGHGYDSSSDSDSDSDHDRDGFQGGSGGDVCGRCLRRVSHHSHLQGHGMPRSASSPNLRRRRAALMMRKQTTVDSWPGK